MIARFKHIVQSLIPRSQTKSKGILQRDCPPEHKTRFHHARPVRERNIIRFATLSLPSTLASEFRLLLTHAVLFVHGYFNAIVSFLLHQSATPFLSLSHRRTNPFLSPPSLRSPLCASPLLPLNSIFQSLLL